MPSELIPVGVRIAVRNAVGGWGPYSIREIVDLFNTHGFVDIAEVPDAGGQRRTTAEGFHARIDWTSEDSAGRYLRLVEDVLDHYPESSEANDGRTLRRELRRAGITHDEGGLLHLPRSSGIEERRDDRLIDEIWIPDRIRVFISHLSSSRQIAGGLAEELNRFAFSCFVAHDAIEPSREWQAVIEHGLATCDALLAYVTPGFRESAWTDQEVGWALGRGLIVVPVRAGADPYGFFGSFQGIPVHSNASAASLATMVVRAFAVAAFSAGRPGSQRLEPKMATAIVQSFCRSGSFETTRRRFQLLRLVPSGLLRPELASQLREAIAENRQISEAMIAEPTSRPAPAAVRDLFPDL